MYQCRLQLIHRQVAPALTVAPAPPTHLGGQTYQRGDADGFRRGPGHRA
jgi:hypothetical protein